MKLNKFKKLLKENGYIVMRAYGAYQISIGHSYLSSENVGAVNESVPGTYTIIKRLPRKITSIIARFANTDIKDRKNHSQKWIALLGMDSIGQCYTAYSYSNGHFEVRDIGTVDSLMNDNTYHLDRATVDALQAFLINRGLPAPRFIPLEYAHKVLTDMINPTNGDQNE